LFVEQSILRLPHQIALAIADEEGYGQPRDDVLEYLACTLVRRSRIQAL
jgi:hypothetical protein